MIRKGTGICIAALITIFSAIGANAQTPVDLKVNESIVKMDSEPFIENGYTLVPLRRTAEALGLKVEWNKNSRSAVVSDTKNTAQIFTGTNTAIVNSTKKAMPQKSLLINGKAYMGVRFLADCFGIEVGWNAKTHTVELKKAGHTVDTKHIEDAYTPEDLEWLAKIVHAEAQGEIHDGKVAVANVIMNRIESSDFPNTVYDVVFDKKYGVQFTPTAIGTIHNNPSSESYHAAKQALFGKNTAGESLYFCNPKISTNFWIINNRTFHKNIGNHDFYL